MLMREETKTIEGDTKNREHGTGTAYREYSPFKDNHEVAPGSPESRAR